MRICLPRIIRQISLWLSFTPLFYSNCWASGFLNEESPWSLIFKFLNVAIFLVIIYKLGAKKTAEFLRDRRQRAKSQIEGALQKEDEAAKMLREWKEKMADAEEEARKVVEASMAEGESLREKALKEAEEEAKRILEQAKVAADEEAKKTKELLVKELAALSALRAEILLKENLDSERQEKLIEECLRKMEGLS